MKKLLSLISLVLVAMMLPAQEDTTYYLNEYWNSCSLKEAKYFRIVKQDSLKPDHYHVFDFKADGQIRMQGTYKALHDSVNWTGLLKPEDCVKNGFHTRYYENGKPMVKKLYVNDYPQAGTKHWYDNGMMSTTGRYLNGKRTGLWHFYDGKGKLHTIDSYFYDRRHGTCKEVIEGSLREDGTFFYGDKLGNYTDWGGYINTKVKRKLTDIDGNKINNVEKLEPLVIIPKWKEGDGFFVKSRVISRLVRDESQIYNIDLEIDAKLDITAKSENGYTVTYSYLDYHNKSASTAEAFMDDPVRTIIDSLKKTPIQIHCDPFGNFEKVDNWKAVQNRFINAIKDVVVKSIGQSSGVFIKRDAIQDSLIPEEFYSEEAINVIVQNELEYLFYALDHCYFPGTILTTKSKNSVRHLNIRSREESITHPVNLSDSSLLIENTFEFEGNALTGFLNEISLLPAEVSYFFEEEKKFKRAEMNVQETRSIDLTNNMPHTYDLIISFGDDEIKFQAEVATRIVAE